MPDRCPHCGHETDADVCPLCGSEVRGGREDEAAPGAGPAPGDGAGAGATVAWEDPAVPFPADLWRSWKESLFAPGDFFRKVGESGYFGRPLLYFLLMTVVGAVFVLVWQTALPLPAGPRSSPVVPEWWRPEIRFFLAPFVAMAGLVITTVVYHLGALALAPDRGGMGATARVVCYSAGPSVLAVLPVLGSLVASVWMLVLQVVGLREVHRTSTGRAVLMVFWIWLALFLFVAILVALAIAYGAGGEGAGWLALGHGPLPAAGP